MTQALYAPMNNKRKKSKIYQKKKEKINYCLQYTRDIPKEK
jgi:hypothetical protein